MADGATVIVGGTSGLGRHLAETYARRGRDVVITGRDSARAQHVAKEIGGDVRGTGLDLTQPQRIADGLRDVGPVDALVLAAVERDTNSVRDYRQAEATRLATLKIVGYTEVLHCLLDRMHEEAAVLIYGGLAKDRPYPGSTTVTAVNGAVSSMVIGWATELAPIRVNALHPGIVGDSPMWEQAQEMLERVRDRTPTGRLITMEQVTGAAMFLLQNGAMNGVNLAVDGGWMVL